MAIAEQFQPSHILGIDPDHVLVDSACSKVKRAVYSAQSKAKEENTKGVVTAVVTAQPNAPASKPVKPVAAAFMPRSIAIRKVQNKPLQAVSVAAKSDAENPTHFPYNVRFKARNLFDVSCNLCPTVEGKYDVVTCFSVTKWVQLNGGDEKLVEFLCRLYCLVRRGGRVIIEYQPWKSYENNKSASETTKKMFPGLKIRPEHFERLLSEYVGFEVECRRGAALAEAKGFARPIVVLRRPVTVEREARWSSEKDIPALVAAVQQECIASMSSMQDSMAQAGAGAACSTDRVATSGQVKDRLGGVKSADGFVPAPACDETQLPGSARKDKRAAREDSDRSSSKKVKHR
jgi:7SK snRNA methylphosphate capping enzyme